MRDRNDIKRVLEAKLREAFPHDTVDVSDGYKKNIHVIVVSRAFDGMKERDKQERLWELIDETDLKKSEKQLISLVLPASPETLKSGYG